MTTFFQPDTRRDAPSRVLAAGTLLVAILLLGSPETARAQRLSTDQGPIDNRPVVQAPTTQTLSTLLGLDDQARSNLAAEDPGHLFGGAIGHARQRLADRGVDIEMLFWPQFSANLNGGLRRSQDYASQIGATVQLDLQKLLGWRDTQVFVGVTQRNGRNLAADALGNAAFHPAQIYGAGGNTVVHLTYVYLEKSWMQGRLKWTIGRYGTGPDYNSSMLGCEFEGLTICSQSRASYVTAYASWPNTAWGADLKYRPTSDTYVVPGVFATDPNHGGIAGTAWGGPVSGTTLAFEAGWEPVMGPRRLAGHYKVGVMWDSSFYRYNAVLSSGAGRHGQTLSWFYADQMLWRHGAYATAGLIGIVGYTHATASISQLSDQFYGGFLDFGLVPGRPHDGFGAIWSIFRYGANQPAGMQPQGLPGSLVPVLDDVRGGIAYGSTERVIDVTYRALVCPGVYVAPDYQHLWRPGGGGTVRGADIVGLNTRFYF